MFPSPTEPLPAFCFCFLATANLAKMNVWDLELSKLQEMQKQGSVCIAWLCFIVVSIAKRCQCHQPASVRDQGINLQGKRYPSSVRSVCRREQRQHEETSTMQHVVSFLCVTNGPQPWTLCPHCSQECECKFDWDGVKELSCSGTVFSAKSKLTISVWNCLLTWILQTTLSFVHLPLHDFWFRLGRRHVDTSCRYHGLWCARVNTVTPLARPSHKWGQPALSVIFALLFAFKKGDSLLPP